MNTKMERRNTYPVMKRKMSYDRTLFNREMFNKAYNLTTSTSASSPPSNRLEISTSTSSIQEPSSSPTISISPTASPIEMTSVSTSVSTTIISDEPYSFTGLSSPNLSPYKFVTTNSSVDGLLAPPSINDQNRSRKRNNSPFGRDFGKEITEDFLFGDDLSL